MNDKLVSIIIPAYNVKKYIQKCIDSALNQDYEKIEIIVIDDGSTDGTSDIIDSYGKRIKVVHKDNNGVSSARNCGIQMSNGDYVTFVDGDDYIDPNFVSTMMKVAQQYDSDFVYSINCYTQINEVDVRKKRCDLVSNEYATGELLSPKVIVGCWNKLFSKRFLDNNQIRFNENLFYGEGLNFIISCAQKANNIVCINNKVYFYRRNNEFSATSRFSIEKYINGEDSLRNIYKSLEKKNMFVDTMWLLHMNMFYLGGITKMKSNSLNKVYRQEFKCWKRYIERSYLKLMISKYVNPYRKLLLLAGIICPGFLGSLEKKRKKRISKKSVS